MKSDIEKIVERLRRLGWKISTMESCTGGNVINTITNVQGASEITDGGFVTYSNKQKIRMGVPEKVIKQYGVYSKETAIEMAVACREMNKCEVGIGVTGTFSNTDKNNKDSIALKAYYSIYINNSLYCFGEDIPDTDRDKQKEYLTMQIVSKLGEILSKAI